MEKTIEEKVGTLEYIYRDITISNEYRSCMRSAVKILELLGTYKEVEVQIYDPVYGKYQCVGMLNLMVTALKGAVIKFRAKGTDAKEVLTKIAETLDGCLKTIKDYPTGF